MIAAACKKEGAKKKGNNSRCGGGRGDDARRGGRTGEAGEPTDCENLAPPNQPAKRKDGVAADYYRVYFGGGRGADEDDHDDGEDYGEGGWRMRGCYNPDEEGEEDEGCGAMLGRGCAWCMINHSDIPLFFLSFIVLYLSINRCCYCVMVVAIISALLCMRFPLLNATLWSSLIVLYLHKDWNLNFGNVKVSWNRAS